jgi:hypothetical protein
MRDGDVKIMVKRAREPNGSLRIWVQMIGRNRSRGMDLGIARVTLASWRELLAGTALDAEARGVLAVLADKLEAAIAEGEAMKREEERALGGGATAASIGAIAHA